MRRLGRSAASLALVVCALGVAPGAAQAGLEIGPGDVRLRVLDAAGNPDNRAGIHPDRLEVVMKPRQTGPEDENIKEVQVDFPLGLSGDPSATPTCSRRAFEEDPYVVGYNCPREAQVGQLVVRQSTENPWPIEIYNLERAPNEVAAFGIQPFIGHSKMIGSLRRSDYGLSMTVTEVTQEDTFAPPLDDVKFEFWGVPADRQTETSIPRRPFLTTPTRCDGPLEVETRLRTWQQPGHMIVARAGTGTPLTGCNELPFSPQLDLELDNPVADAPSGLDLGVSLPHNEDPGGRVHSQIKHVSIALPDGTSLSPGAAAGLAICTDSQLALGGEAEAACPPASRVGTVELVSPALGETLVGSVYLRGEAPGDRFRIAMVANARGTEIKLTGSLRPNPVTGRLVAQLSDLPQGSFSHLRLHLEGGPLGLVATSLRCGPATATATFTPYSGTAPVTSSDAVALAGHGGTACGPAPFAPGFAAGVSNLAAGQPTSFAMTLRRRDGEQLPDTFNVALPLGVSASLGAVQPCAMANPAACTPASRVGSAVVEAGTGGAPAVLRGDVFLTGPYRRAPYGLAMVFRAVIGPFDLGTVTMRAALTMDSRSGQFTVQSDSLPALVEGVPIRFQTIGLDIDRPGFMRNPTSCAPATVDATIRSTAGATARVGSGFRVSGCGALAFRPSLALGLTGKKELRRGGKPGLRINMQNRSGGTNLRALDIRLPRAMKLDSGGVGRLCARRDALAGDCPAGARVGTARGATPLLNEPLTGSIYAAQPKGSGPPDLWVKLTGAGLEFNLRSTTAVDDGQLHTRLTEVPDAPISKLSMSFVAGKRGLFSLRQGVCGGKGGLISEVATEGQNGAYGLLRVPVKAPSSKGCADGPGKRKSDGDKGRGAGRRGR